VPGRVACGAGPARAHAVVLWFGLASEVLDVAAIRNNWAG
jgi:hypothetical protein